MVYKHYTASFYELHACLPVWCKINISLKNLIPVFVVKKTKNRKTLERLGRLELVNNILHNDLINSKTIRF